MKKAIKMVIDAIENGESFQYLDNNVTPMLHKCLERRLDDETISNLWHQSGQMPFKFARLLQAHLYDETSV